MITYFDLGSGRRLNEIVMAGTHDAGITSGASFVQTQSLDIAYQALSGVRIFDLRIAGKKSTSGLFGKPKTELRAYHSAVKAEFSASKVVAGLAKGQKHDVKEALLIGGSFGMGLERMLSDAAGFVRERNTEFLLLKFEKCSNWPEIAEMCLKVLGDRIYRGAGNLNTTTLDQLKGKVVVLFSETARQKLDQSRYGIGSGILGIRNLNGKEGAVSYMASYNGLQYFGKGGTSVMGRDGFNENVTKQSNLMSKGAAHAAIKGNRDVMGMMYWTITGLFGDIKKRNAGMWTAENADALNKLWSEGLSESIEARLASNVDPTSFSAGGTLKTFMPNFVMIDFADIAKCKTIYELNQVAATRLTQAARIAKAGSLLPPPNAIRAGFRPRR